MMAKLVAAAFAASLASVALAAGNSKCPCARDYADLSSYTSGASLMFKVGRETQTVPESYGVACAAHDQSRSPFCTGSVKPAWCSTPWCYVDPGNCDASVVKAATRTFPGTGLYFSYATCAGTSSGAGSPSASSLANWTSADVDGTRQMVELVESYTKSARNVLETTATEGSLSGCAADEICSGTSGTCSSCSTMEGWGKVDFAKVGTHLGPSGSAAAKDNAKCLAKEMAEEYSKVGAKELDPDYQRIGFQYFADQATGSYTSWPKEDSNAYCAADWDPRMRPWYAAGATGAKDVVIVVDVSGSMTNNDRHLLARKAVKAIIKVLTWKDFATIILFNNNVYRKYSDLLRPVSESEQKAMLQWVDSSANNWKSGGTNFAAAFEGAMEVISNSVSAGKTSMCQKAILFMTDGKDDGFLESNFQYVADQAKKYDAFVFTYALGDGSDTVKPKKLACENRGIYYKVPDGGDLGAVMAKFYDYFVQGQEMCSASWVKYSAASTGQELYAGCLPMYDRDSTSGGLMGVTCMDVSLIETVSDMKTKAGWSHFVCQASDITKKCRAVQLTECDRQKMRRAYSEDSVCGTNSDASATASTVCQCTSPSCQDDASYIDAQNYFCDTWVGDNCDEADTKWGYSTAEKNEILQKCKRSCNKCPLLPAAQCGPPRTAPEECMAIQVEEKCRACLGKTSGLDIEGNAMACPGAGGAGGGADDVSGGVAGKAPSLNWCATTFFAVAAGVSLNA